MTPVTLHTVYDDPTATRLCLECPETGQVLSVPLNLDHLRELHASAAGHVARAESILTDPYAPAVDRLAKWRARHADGGRCEDCDPTPAPCTCEIADPLIGRSHGETKYPMTEAEQLRDALAGR